MNELDNLIKAMEQAKALREQNEKLDELLKHLWYVVGPYSVGKSRDLEHMAFIRNCLKDYFNFEDGK